MAVITSPITGETINALNIGDVMGFAYADLNRFLDSLSGADITLKYPELERSYGEWGALLREGRIPATSSVAVDKNATALCGPYYFTADSRYYNDWTEKKYVKEIRRVEVSKILRGEAEYSDFLSRIIQSNLEGYRNEVNTGIETAFIAAGAGTPSPTAMLNFDSPGAITGGFLAQNGNRYEVLESPTFTDVWAEILAKTLDMTNANSAYTEGSDVWGASSEDLVIYLPQHFAAFSDVKYRQRLENAFGIDKLPTIRLYNQPQLQAEIATENVDVQAVFIMDKRTLNHVVRYMEYNDDRVACRESLQVSLHVEDMIKYVPFYKAYAIIFPMPANP